VFSSIGSISKSNVHVAAILYSLHGRSRVMRRHAGSEFHNISFVFQNTPLYVDTVLVLRPLCSWLLG
jgi:hypothetical protein